MVRGLVQDGAQIKMFADSALCLSIDLEECSAIEDDFLAKLVYCFLDVIPSKGIQFQITSATIKLIRTLITGFCQRLI